ncbi:hypothetical protein LLG39_12445, partial [bacterium]|nr:hypothetical protein [bacterium]
GTLVATRSPVVHDPISYSVANGFSRTNIQGNLGDTIVWRNDTTDDFSMEIIDDSGEVVISKTILKTQEYSFKEFPQAGCYTYRKMGSTTVKGTVTLYGVPTPDGDFQSMSLVTDRTFSTLFTIPGTHKFYILNESDPNKSFITGSVIVR